MNRNGKHPGKTHRRKANATDRTHNRSGYRITGSWDQRPDRPAIRATPDRKAARRIARQMADEGAFVIVEEHLGHSAFRTLYEVDGPALLAERAAAEQAAAEAAERARVFELHRAAAAEAARLDRARRDADAARYARELMTAPPNTRTDRRARHTAGGR
jgi:hypothetical protein